MTVVILGMGCCAKHEIYLRTKTLVVPRQACIHGAIRRALLIVAQP